MNIPVRNVGSVLPFPCLARLKLDTRCLAVREAVAVRPGARDGSGKAPLGDRHGVQWSLAVSENLSVIVPVTERLSRRAASCVAPFSNLHLDLADEALFRRFRRIEPGLVSCADDQRAGATPRLDYPALHHRQEPAGVLSLVIQGNAKRRDPADLFARIDIVVVEPRFRGLGFGKLLVLAALVHVLDAYEGRLYSISSLAAHPAMERILEQVGFTGTPRANRDFVHEELKLETVNHGVVMGDLTAAASAAAHQASFRARQQFNSS